MEESYTDRKGNTHRVVHHVANGGQDRGARQQKIVDELYALFTANQTKPYKQPNMPQRGSAN